jgi:hypothetical protein
MSQTKKNLHDLKHTFERLEQIDNHELQYKKFFNQIVDNEF